MAQQGELGQPKGVLLPELESLVEEMSEVAAGAVVHPGRRIPKGQVGPTALLLWGKVVWGGRFLAGGGLLLPPALPCHPVARGVQCHANMHDYASLLLVADSTD